MTMLGTNWENMLPEINGLDYGILALIMISVLLGILRGFVREAMSLVTWIAAIVLGVLYCDKLSQIFTMISMPGLRIILAFVLIVLCTLIFGGILSYLIGRLIRFTGFGATDRIIGT